MKIKEMNGNMINIKAMIKEIHEMITMTEKEMMINIKVRKAMMIGMKEMELGGVLKIEAVSIKMMSMIVEKDMIGMIEIVEIRSVMKIEVID